MLLLEERSDCGSVDASLPLPLSQAMINTSRMEEEGEKIGGGSKRRHLILAQKALFILDV